MIMPSAFASAAVSPVRCEQHFLGFADADFPGVRKIFRSTHTHGHGVVLKHRVLARDDQIAGQTSISPPAMHFPWTWAIVGLGIFRQRSLKPM